MRSTLLFAIICWTTVCSQRIFSRTRRQAYVLPSGAESITGPIKTSFKCPQDKGYFADVDNECRIFHICEPEKQSSFICNAGTVFNQLTLTCSSTRRSIPCRSSPDFYYLNSRIGDPKAIFLTPEDMKKVAALY